MSALILSVVLSRIDCDGICTFSSSNDAENLSESVLNTRTETTNALNHYRKPFLPFGLETDDCVLRTTALLYFIHTQSRFCHILRPLPIPWPGLRLGPTETSM